MNTHMKRNALMGATHTREAQMIGTGAKDNDTITFVIVSDNNEGMRYDWYSGETYIERLDISGANMDRLNTFFKDHTRSVDAAIGCAVNKRQEGTLLLTDVKFDESGIDVKRKYENGTLTDVSIGYEIKAYTVEEREGQPDLVTVTEFDIFELSAVGIGFDQGAKKRGVEGFDPEQLRAMNAKLDRVESILNKGDRK